MRIGIDARLYTSAFTGIGRYVYELIDHLLALDKHNHYVLFFNEVGYHEFANKHSNVEKILVNAPHYSLAEQWKFWRMLEAAKLDLMHFTHFNAPLLYRRSSIVTIHDLTLSMYPGNKMNKWWQRLAYNVTMHSVVRRARQVIAVSEHTKKDLVRLTRTPPSKIVVIHEGVNPAFHTIKDHGTVDEFRKKNGLGKPYLLYTGVWRSHKNLINLIKAFGILKREKHFDGLLVITGKEDPWYPEVKKTVHDERLEGSVRFTGLIPDKDLVMLYNGALVYVFPSLYEGFGLPALEAFACGIPVCAANSSSLPEICGEGNAAFFDPHNPRDIAEKIASVYTDPQYMQQLVIRGAARLKDFSWGRMARKTLDIYNAAANVHTAQ